MADGFSELVEEINKFQRALQGVAETEKEIPAGTPLIAVPAMLAALLAEERKKNAERAALMEKFVEAISWPYDSEWKSRIRKAFDLKPR